MLVGNMKKLLVCAAMLLAAGCAKAPDDIAAAHVATDSYMQMECPQLSSLRSQKQTQLAALEKEQLAAARQDAAAMAVIHIPYATMTGMDKEPEYARAKGEVKAINAAYQSKSCTG